MFRDPLLWRRFLVRPALFLWSLAAVAIVLLVVAEAILPGDHSPARHLFSYRDNLETPQWRAAAATVPQIVSGYPVVVEDELGIYLYNLRYLLYPTPVWDVTDLPPGYLDDDSLYNFVTFDGDSVSVREVRQ
ncbi:MAG: hypothetical protein ABIF77_16855 [bacterium]